MLNKEEIESTIKRRVIDLLAGEAGTVELAITVTSLEIKTDELANQVVLLNGLVKNLQMECF